ncbi:MAG: SagB/ThcOx family dehydrogenase [Candidatus Methanofastidiosia archaeon]
MSNILEKLCGMSYLEKNLFLHLMVENDKTTDFLAILNEADKEMREKVYRSLPAPWVDILKSKYTETTVSKAVIHPAEKEIHLLFKEAGKTAEEISKYEAEHKNLIREARNLMKAGAHADFPCTSDQSRGIEVPPLQKEYDSNAALIDLLPPDTTILKKPHILDCIKDRKSRRKFTDEHLTLKELSYLLWVTQGVRKVTPNGKMSYRTVPSGGARQPFETYVAVQRITGIPPGMYRYLPFGHELVHLFADEKMSEKLTDLAYGQKFVGNSAVVFIWSVIPYRSEWRYELEAKKDILQESGHICQNLYLACESISCGTCAIGAYDQEGVDHYLGLDGEDEFVIYLAPVGKVKVDE